MDGNIIDIKKFTVHDGPGIRSTVFLKGCPLRCLWCQNPEGMENKISLWYFEKKCIGCHHCVKVCPNQALTVQTKPPHILIDKTKCVNCGECVNVCPTTALCFDGQKIPVEEVVAILLEDKPFYEQSGGGITLSGGDPLFQADFGLEILKICRNHGIHTAIETSMHGRRRIIAEFVKYVDQFIVDLKLLDPGTHQKYTGVDNRLILSNFHFLASQNVKLMVRIPLIPGITATRGNVRDIARLVHEANPTVPVELINFNPLAENKYRLMGKGHEMSGELKPLSGAELDELYQVIAGEGVAIIRETKLG